MNYPDIFFTPAYHDLFADTGFGGIPAFFSCAGIDYQYYLRPVTGTPWSDTVSPYGYDGPVAVEEKADWAAYLSAFGAHCRREGIIAEFARLHPFKANHERLALSEVEGQALSNGPEDILQGQDIFYIDLSMSDEEIQLGFDKGCLSAVKKAQRNGLEVEIVPRISPAFVWLYLETMRRIDTDPNYIFNATLFYNLENWLRGSFANINVSCRGRLLASALLLFHGRYGHYFLAGSDWEMRQYCANNLLITASASFLRQRGCQVFNLGGGLIHGDSLESFKKSFTRLKMPYFMYRKVHNREIYEELCRAKGIDPASPGYFPAYRRQI